MTLFALSYRERVALGGLAAHTEDAKVFCRANALLWSLAKITWSI